MNSIHRTILIVAALLLTAASHHAPATTALTRCSLSPGLGVRTRSETILLAIASTDTVVTRHALTRGQGGRGQAPDVNPPSFGQVFRVQRFGGADSAALARAFRNRGNSNVAIVPWDHDPACILHRRTSHFVWVKSSQPGAFVLQMRPDSLWTDGMPVFDAFATTTLPWPHAEIFRDTMGVMRPSMRTATELSADEYFDLLLAMPTREEQRDRPESAWASFLRWRAANAVSATRFPANQIAYELAIDILSIKEARAVRLIDPVIAGTYRMSLSLNGGPPRDFYLRTSSRAHAEWHATGVLPARDPAGAIPTPDAYSVMASGALSPEGLSRNCINAGMSFGTGYMYVIDPQRSTRANPRQWRGWIELSLVAAQFRGDSAIDDFRLRASDEWDERFRTAVDYEAPALFQLGNDGVLRVEQTTRLRDGRSIVISGARISPESVPCN